MAVALMIVAGASVEQSEAATFRYRLSGDWTAVTDGTSAGWGLNPNNDGSPGAGLPGASDDARINFGNNTVSVTSAVPAVNRVQIGVDESGIVVVENGGVLTANQDVLAGNNNSNATGTLIVNDGGVVDVGRILWAANNDSNGVIDVRAGGTINAANHFWWGVTGNATIDVAGTINQTDGILGLGTSNASTPSGGTALVTIQDGGLLALNNISGAAGLPSIQAGSLIDIEGSGELTLPGDFVGLLTDYANAGKLAGAGVPGMTNLAIDLTRNPGFTTAYVIPEPAGLLLGGMVAAALFAARRR
ncbi:hypothetical protein [Botrimarina sp.]|uniref:hypothetical protein n=1 Tax=Botrimarina sp. TaxID=2795802 RepID=UPI0032ED3CA9